MRITRIKIENFGPHEKIDWEIGAGVVGVVGENGKGKTHILLALEFAMTGDLPGNRKIYIRHGSEKSSVEVWFEQNNIRGRIKRNLGSSVRELDWDGNSYTALAEVDEMFGQILGARKESFKNSSFIRQGELKNVLDGTETQRRNILIKLLSLGFVERRRSQLDSKITMYAQNNLDESVYGRRDQLREQMETTTTEVGEIQSKIDDMAVYEPDISSVQTYLGQRKALEEEKQNLATVDHQIKTQYNPKQIEDYEETVEQISKLEAKLTQANLQARKHADNKQIVTRSQVTQQEINRIAAGLKVDRVLLETYTQQFKVLTGSDDVDKAPRTLTTMEDDLRKREAWLNCDKSVKLLGRELEETNEGLKTCPPEALQKMAARLQVLAPLVTSSRVTMSILKQGYNALKDASKGECTGDMVTCTKCSLKVIPKEMLTAEALESARKAAEDEEQKYNDLHNEELGLVKEEASLTSRRQKLLNKQEQNKQEIERVEDDMRGLLVGSVSQEAVDNIKSNIESTKSVISMLSKQITLIQVAEENKKRSEVELAATQLPEDVDLATITEQLEAAKKEVDQLDNQLEELREKRKKTAEVYLAREKALERKRYLAEDRIPALELAVGKFEPSDNVQKLLGTMNTNDFQVIYDTMVDAHQEYLTTKNTLQNLQKSLVSLQRQVLDVNKAIDSQERHKKVLDKLKELRKLLEADGVLKSYLSYRFRYLHNTVSKNLNLLDANFVIRPCRDALSYEFLSSDDADDAWLDITRLSGGQKVKLSTAFLISVQETICKDVNFLVLDEPSTHLDEPSVNALGALFTSLATRMDNGNGQIWIVDHHFSLRSACSANFQLGSNDNETE